MSAKKQFQKFILSQFFVLILIILIIIFEPIMGKLQIDLNSQAKNKSECNTKKKKPGRPSNDQIQTAFMNRIREIKLQAINAETQLELQMAFFTTEDDKKARRKQQTSSDDKINKIMEFNLLRSEEKKNLLQIFNKQKQNWKFHQIEEESDLPEYFFDDENDLAFILQQVNRNKRQILKALDSYQNSQIKQNSCNNIKAEELFFLALLCLNSNQSLRDVVLDFFMKNQSLIINLLKASIEKVKTKYFQKVEKAKQNEKLLTQIDNSRNVKDYSMPFQESICEISELPKVKQQTKKIQKPAKKPAKSNHSQSQEQPILTQKQKEEKLILCLVNYISWSYYYIYEEQDKTLRDSQTEDPAKKQSIDKVN